MKLVSWSEINGESNARNFLAQPSLPSRLVGILMLLAMVFSLFAVCLAEEQKSVDPIFNIKMESGDSSVRLSWDIHGVAGRKPEKLKGIRLYQVKEGTEMSFGSPVIKVVADLQDNESCTVKKLVNGEQYFFVLKAYDADNKEYWEKTVVVFPGSNPAGKPRVPANIYFSEGDGRIALFWDKNREADLLGYEIFRKATDDEDFRLVGRVSKVFRIEKKPTVFQAVTPTLFLDRSVENGRHYQYRIRAVDAEGYFSDFTSVVSASAKPYVTPKPAEVLLLVNGWVSKSEEVARYYAEKRNIPEGNIVSLKIPSDFYKFDYARDIQKPLQKFLLEQGLAGKIKYIVPCFGIPVRGAGRAVDSKLADLFDRFTWGRGLGTPNPYFNAGRHFDGTYGIYLVTRLDGPTAEIAKGLVDKALVAEKKVTARSGRGMFVDDEYGKNLRKTGEKLGVAVVLKPDSFTAKELLPDDVYWYFGWRHMYRNIRATTWPDGAVAAHLISYSFSGGFKPLAAKDKNWVQGLLEDGITGTFGAVIEPYQQGYTRADYLFERFWTGEYTFGEAFTMATPTIQWAMSAVGDPLFRLRGLDR
jgi:uncharacterized protein (TIGR03790 family)